MVKLRSHEELDLLLLKHTKTMTWPQQGADIPPTTLPDRAESHHSLGPKAPTPDVQCVAGGRRAFLVTILGTLQFCNHGTPGFLPFFLETHLQR